MRTVLRNAGCLLLALLGCLSLLSLPAAAHEMSMAEMQVRETARGEFFWQWTARDDRQATKDLTPRWPEGCRAEASRVLCGAAGLQGTLAMDGVGRTYSAALVKIVWIDGQTSVYTLTGSQPTVQLFGSADDRRGWGEIASAYTVLGVQHILSGIDHLMFVFGLLFLVGFRRKLVWTITAFTAAHSLTLASAAIGWLTLRPPPVEACIALSIVLVASEALRGRDTLARRLPALVAFTFGLVHGLGFAGALKEIGLPQQHLAVALLTFNLGVEIGQLLTVGLAWGLVWTLRRQPWAPRLKTPVLYAIGSLAAYWSFLRIAAMVA
jgi:hydrogenase/urease accessory protein HupE